MLHRKWRNYSYRKEIADFWIFTIVYPASCKIDKNKIVLPEQFCSIRTIYI